MNLPLLNPENLEWHTRIANIIACLLRAYDADRVNLQAAYPDLEWPEIVGMMMFKDLVRGGYMLPIRESTPSTSVN